MKFSNFYHIYFSPVVSVLYLTDEQVSQGAKQGNLVSRVSKDSVISLFPLENSKKVLPEPVHFEWLVKSALFHEFEHGEDFIDIDYREGEITLLNERLLQRVEYSILRRLVIRVFHAREQLVLAFDPLAKLYNRLMLPQLLEKNLLSIEDLMQHPSCLVFVEVNGKRKWCRARIVEIGEQVKVEVPFVYDGTMTVSRARVLPILNKENLAKIVQRNSGHSLLDSDIKNSSNLTSIQKRDSINSLFDKYMKSVFPIKVGEAEIRIEDRPLSLADFKCYAISASTEPKYIVDRPGVAQLTGDKRLNVLGKVSIQSVGKDEQVVLFATKNTVGAMEEFVGRLNTGVVSGSFEFSLPKKFGINLKITDKFVVSDYKDYIDASDQFLYSTEDKHEALSMVYLPKFSEFYYPLKAKLAHWGKVSQVVSNLNLDIYTAWNIGANIYAKLGHTPWGISEGTGTSNADMVLGFAYSTLKMEGKLRRNIGYVNVFDRHGVWQFMQSSSEYLDFDKRLKLIPTLIRNAVVGFMSGGSSPRIIDIHYSKKFSFQERKKTFEVIKALVPEIDEVNFISIDKGHPLRVFDDSNSNLNLTRGQVIQLSGNEFLLSVAGDVKSTSPASRLLKVKVWKSPMGTQPIDLFTIAFRILAMSKLNWRSAVRETVEPVTLKYAEEIARLTNHFSMTEWGTVNNRLNRIPWFI